jgi:hypothetical protein
VIFCQYPTTYDQQIENGKNIVKEILSRLAKELNQPQIADFSFLATDLDFDNSEVSIWDPEQEKIVVKIKQDDLADAPATPGVRRKIEAQLQAAMKAHVSATNTAHK